MTTTPTHPEWATVGATVAIDHGGLGPSAGMSLTTVTKVTARAIVTTGNRRFTAGMSGKWVDKKTDNRWVSATLVAADDPRVVAYFANQARGAAAYTAEQALLAWRNDPAAANLAELRAALDALAPYLADTDTTED
jgi:hypothetical protein